MVHQFYLVLVLVIFLVTLRELEENGEMGIFGATIALGIDFQSPLHTVELAGVGVDDGIRQLSIILEDIVKFGILGDEFMTI